jgi:hypothetical protein
MERTEPEPGGQNNPTRASLSFIEVSEALSNCSLAKTGLRVLETGVIVGAVLAVAALVRMHGSGGILSMIDTSNPEQLRKVWGAISWTIASVPAIYLAEGLIKGLRPKIPRNNKI